MRFKYEIDNKYRLYGAVSLHSAPIHPGVTLNRKGRRTRSGYSATACCTLINYERRFKCSVKCRLPSPIPSAPSSTNSYSQPLRNSNTAYQPILSLLLLVRTLSSVTPIGTSPLSPRPSAFLPDPPIRPVSHPFASFPHSCSRLRPLV